jgi:hypothetical protein
VHFVPRQAECAGDPVAREMRFCEPAHKVAPSARASTTAQAGPMPASDWNGHRLSEVESRRLARIPFMY